MWPQPEEYRENAHPRITCQQIGLRELEWDIYQNQSSTRGVRSGEKKFSRRQYESNRYSAILGRTMSFMAAYELQVYRNCVHRLKYFRYQLLLSWSSPRVNVELMSIQYWQWKSQYWRVGRLWCHFLASYYKNFAILWARENLRPLLLYKCPPFV